MACAPISTAKGVRNNINGEEKQKKWQQHATNKH